MTKKIEILLVLLALMTGLQAQNDTVNGYVCSHGVDTTMWITLDNPVTINTQSNFDWNDPIAIGFDLLYFGQARRWVKLSRHGTVTFEHESPSNYNHYMLWPNTLFPFGILMDWHAAASYWKYQTFGTPGNRVLVFEYCGIIHSDGSVIICTYQIHLREADNSIHFVYKQSAPGAFSRILMTESGEAISIANHHGVGYFWRNDDQPWPGDGHYYSFVPQPCLPRVNANIRYNSPTSVTLFLQPINSQTVANQIEYGPTGFIRGTGTHISTTLSKIDIDDFNSEEGFDFYITPLCADSSKGITKVIRHRASCSLTDATSNLINYWDLQQTDVTCSFGSLSTSGTSIGIIDYGDSSQESRHTVHSDTSETDPYTMGELHTVPEGHCYSVRLGNMLSGGERERITYHLHVDTNSYDLLLLRYAIVEEDPNHPATLQPFFTFGIYDTNGGAFNACYYANFVAGDFSGWNRSYNGNTRLVWHNWQIMGVDLSPLHGMDINVALDNADCAAGGHFGYSYFTLESATKHIRADYCGATDTNILRAPKGFTYRWYRDGDSRTTLSTADSLVVTDGDRYFCEATYLLRNTSCHILLSSYGGSRYPVADFDFKPQNVCGNVCQLINRSLVARDSLRTQTTSTPCDSYLWRFDDGTTSTLTSPTHRFTSGTHAVTLYAMLADGQCIDSVTKSIDIVTVADTSISMQTCSSDTLFFGDSAYTVTGDYICPSTENGCTLFTHLHLTVLPDYHFHHADTFQNGQSYTWRGSTYRRPGLYQNRFTTTAGCDSIYALSLSCIEQHDTLVCQDDLPLYWHGRHFDTEGTDTLVFPIHAGADSIVLITLRTRKHPDYATSSLLHCDGVPYYSIVIPDSMIYTFRTDPYDPQIDSLSRIIPSMPTLLIIQSNYPSEPTCPSSDTLILEPLRPLVAHLEVQPKWIDESESDITATDRSKGNLWREWYINNELQESQEPSIRYHSDLQGDSVTVMLVIGIDECTDTAYTTIYIRHQDLLWFPNVFTPDLLTNNLFRAYGINIRDYDLQIFTRWGERIFRTHDMAEGWDGTSHGIRLPQGTYAYVCTYTTPTDEKKRMYGAVTLIR